MAGCLCENDCWLPIRPRLRHSLFYRTDPTLPRQLVLHRAIYGHREVNRLWFFFIGVLSGAEKVALPDNGLIDFFCAVAWWIVVIIYNGLDEEMT